MQNFISMIMNSLKSMALTAIIDILVVAFIFYKVYMLIKETRAEQLLKGIAFIIKMCIRDRAKSTAYAKASVLVDDL